MKAISKAQAQSFDPHQLRNALGSFATGVTIITANDVDPDTYVGVTANSFNSVSLDPPLVLWNLAKKARSLPAYQSSEYFAVNVLASDQTELANRFATQQPGKFNDVDFELGVGGIPLLAGCAAHFQCKRSLSYEGGDHVIFVGEVLQFDDFNRPGLVFYKGKFAVSRPYPQIDQSETGGFVDDYLHYLLLMAAYRFEENFCPIIEQNGLNHYEWRVLAMLSDRAGRNLADLAQNTPTSQPEIEKVLEKMVRTNLIERKGDVDSGYYLTGDGNLKAVQLLAAAKAHEADTLSVLGTTEAQSLKESLKMLLKNIS
ncbi:MAG: flavin reductase [Gammaproteobacteria bacterium]|jgi:3-hydroxy-9,10-secoandrosta-1,3,5(10)-triene-9,17-dione monooxygenase reductase component|nr:flavin reductase [Gammaproteobacteria bacterium]